MTIYLDYNATAPIRAQAAAAMAEAMQQPLNPSSVHRFGREAKKRIEAARAALAERLSCFPGEIVFTGSGTEANNMVLAGFAGQDVLTSAIEHASVLNASPDADRVPVDGEGRIRLDVLEAMLADAIASTSQPRPPTAAAMRRPPPTSPRKRREALETALEETGSHPFHRAPAESLPPFTGGDLAGGEAGSEGLKSKHQQPIRLVSLMLANNETGVLQPVAEAAEIAHRHGAKLHCDAAQAFGKIPLDLGLLGADFVTLAAHKMGGPLGAGALVIRLGNELPVFLRGGGQETRRRAGTENIAAVLGWQAAIEANDAWPERNRRWHEALEARLLAAAPAMRILGRHAPRLPNTSSLLMPGVPAETQLIHFDLAGFALSAGSACSSGRIEPSHVARAMGIDDAGSVIRVSTGWATIEAEMAAFGEAWIDLHARLGHSPS